jgi:hypothetical protein
MPLAERIFVRLGVDYDPMEGGQHRSARLVVHGSEEVMRCTFVTAVPWCGSMAVTSRSSRRAGGCSNQAELSCTGTGTDAFEIDVEILQPERTLSRWRRGVDRT